MHRRTRICWLGMVGALVLMCTVEAYGQRRLMPRGGLGTGGRVTIQWDARAPQSEYRGNPYEYYRQIYPKYRGGFHARELDNIGIPTGDIGLRGNGMFWSPW